METLARLVLHHRRPLAALFAGLAVLLALVRLESEPPGRHVVAAAHDLASGTVLGEGDLARVRLPVDAVPEHGFVRPADVVGRTVAGPMREGEVVTDRRVVQADRMGGYPDGTVLVTVRLADADALTHVRVGDRVDVVAVDQDVDGARVVARDAEIVTLPPAGDDTGGVPVGLAAQEADALDLAERALDSRLSVLASRP